MTKKVGLFWRGFMEGLRALFFISALDGLKIGRRVLNGPEISSFLSGRIFFIPERFKTFWEYFAFLTLRGCFSFFRSFVKAFINLLNRLVGYLDLRKAWRCLWKSLTRSKTHWRPFTEGLHQGLAMHYKPYMKGYIIYNYQKRGKIKSTFNTIFVMLFCVKRYGCTQNDLGFFFGL